MFSFLLYQAFKSSKTHPERITKTDKKWLKAFIMVTLNFLFLKKITARLKRRTESALICLVMKMVWFIQFIYHEKFEDYMDFLLMTDGNKLHHVYIKDLTNLCAIRQNKNKKHFCRYCL